MHHTNVWMEEGPLVLRAGVLLCTLPLGVSIPPKPPLFVLGQTVPPTVGGCWSRAARAGAWLASSRNSLSLTGPAAPVNPLHPPVTGPNTPRGSKSRQKGPSHTPTKESPCPDPNTTSSQGAPRGSKGPAPAPGKATQPHVTATPSSPTLHFALARCRLRACAAAR